MNSVHLPRYFLFDGMNRVHLKEDINMPVKPVISKIRCHNPNDRVVTSIRNRNLLVYIATRDGVDLTPVKSEQEFLQKELYADAEYDEHYHKYIVERPGSCGLFGNIDKSLKQLASDVYNLSKQGRNIYNGIISLWEDDAVTLGYDNKQTWVNLMNKMMPDIAKEFGIDITQLQWTAAVHMEKGHPHCHYMFWSKEPIVKAAYIHKSVQHRCREMFSKEIFEQERIVAVIEKTAKRDFILDFGKELMEDEISYLFKNEIPGRIKREDTNAIGALLINISEKLPTSGRLAYQFVSPQVKEEIDNITAYILKLPAIKSVYQEYISLNREIMKTYSTGKNKEDYKRQRAVDDLKKRIGNQIIKCAKEIRFNRENILNEIIDKCQEFFPDELDSSILNINEPEDELSEPGSLYEPGQEPDEAGSLHALEQEPDEPGSLHELEQELGEAGSLHEVDEIDLSNFIIEWNENYKAAMHFLYDPKEKDINMAISFLNKEIERNNVLAIYEKGRIYERELTSGGTGEYDKLYKTALKGFKYILNSDFENKKYIHYRMAKMYQYGQGTEKNEKRAVKEYIKAGNNKYAQYSLGNMYLRGQGVEITEENKMDYMKEALRLFKNSADQNNAYADYSYAALAEKTFHEIPKDEVYNYYENALEKFVNMYQKSPNDDLAFKIAGMYISGKGTEIDIDKGMPYLQDSRNMKNLNAEYLTGKLYSETGNKYYNMDEAIKAFEKVAESDSYMNNFANYQLGKIYSEVPEYMDMEKAMGYLETAASQDNEYAQCRLGDIYNNPEGEYYDREKAEGYYQAAAEQGSATGQYKRGKLYMEKEQLPEAIEMFEKAAEQGNTYAYYQLGKIYLDKNNNFNQELGFSYLQKGIQLGNENAQIEMGCQYLFGKSEPYIEKNVQKGIELIKEVAEKGNEYAQSVLDFYENYREAMATATAYGLCRNAFNMLTNANKQRKMDKLAENKLHRVHSKEMKKVLAKRGREVEDE